MKEETPRRFEVFYLRVYIQVVLRARIFGYLIMSSPCGLPHLGLFFWYATSQSIILSFSSLFVTERKHVVDWLEGKVQESDRIAPLACGYRCFLLW